MTLNMKDFDSLNDLVKYVNDQAIVQANIQLIRKVDGRWYLLWWA